MRKQFLFFVCLLLGFLIVGSTFQVPLVHAPYIGENCVLYLPMNEGSGTIAYDQSTYKNNGTLLPVGSEPQWVNSKSPAYGKALSFDGTNDYVSIPSSASLRPTRITLSMWLKFNATTGTYQDVYDTDTYSSAYGLCIEVTPTLTGAYISLGHVIYELYFAYTFVLGTYYHYGMTYDGTNIKVYINSFLVATFSVSGAPDMIWNPASSIIFGSTASATYRFKGDLDEVRIYNRALTQSEITVLYNAGFTSTHSETFIISDSLTQRQEQKQVLSEVFSYSDGMTITQEQKHIIQESTITTFFIDYHQNLAIVIQDVLGIAVLAFIIAVVALALVLVYQRQKD